MKRLAWWLAVVSGTVWLTLLLSAVIYLPFMVAENLPQVAGMPFGRLYANYGYLIGYLHAPFLSFSLPDFPSSISAASHFADVRTLLLLDIAIFLVCAPFAWSYYKDLKKRHTRYTMRGSVLIGALVPPVLGLLMAINFDAVFVGFHQLMFRNSDWLFDPATDPIIDVLPEEFFAACFVLAIVLFELVMLLVWRAGKRDLEGQTN